MDSTQAGPARLQLLARQSGTYSLTLVSNSQEALGSGPIQVNCACRLPLGCSQGKLLRLLPFHKATSSALCLFTRQTPLPLLALHFIQAYSVSLCLGFCSIPCALFMSQLKLVTMLVILLLRNQPCFVMVLQLVDVLQAHVVPAPACPDTSTWVVQGSSSHSNGRHHHTLQAGQPVQIEVDLRDAYSNSAGECSQPVSRPVT